MATQPSLSKREGTCYHLRLQATGMADLWSLWDHQRSLFGSHGGDPRDAPVLVPWEGPPTTPTPHLPGHAPHSLPCSPQTPGAGTGERGRGLGAAGGLTQPCRPPPGSASPPRPGPGLSGRWMAGRRRRHAAPIPGGAPAAHGQRSHRPARPVGAWRRPGPRRGHREGTGRGSAWLPRPNRSPKRTSRRARGPGRAGMRGAPALLRRGGSGPSLALRF